MPARRLLAAALCTLVLAGCGGSSGGDDPVEAKGVRDRAVQELVAWGLPKAEAECITDRLGAETVVEAPDIGVLTDGGDYRAAAEACLP